MTAYRAGEGVPIGREVRRGVKAKKSRFLAGSAARNDKEFGRF
jgi:hypothetical protein